MVYLCRDNIARFFHKHELRERAAIVRGQCGAERLPVMTITAAADPAPAQSDEVLATPALRGHVLGNVLQYQWQAYGQTPSTATRTSRPTHDPRR